MSHRRVKHPAALVLAGPRSGEARTLIHIARHPLRVLDENDMNVGRKILESVPFFEEIEVLEALSSRKTRIDHAHPCFLLLAVNDEFAAEHSNVRIDFATGLVTVPGA